MSKFLVAALFGACAFAFVAAPVSIDLTFGKITMKSALAKNGADDVLPDDRGADPAPHR
jgi:hypothetical protein